jgi:hypothetical protein
MLRSFAASSSTLAPHCARLIDQARRAWTLRHRALLQRHGKAVTLGIALRRIRTARTEQALLATIEEILVHHLGVDAFAVFDTGTPQPKRLIARGLAPEDTSPVAIARVPLGAGEFVLGALCVYRLIARKDALDAFDHELLAALGPQIAVSLHAARFEAARPTIRPPRTPRPEEA